MIHFDTFALQCFSWGTVIFTGCRKTHSNGSNRSVFLKILLSLLKYSSGSQIFQAERKEIRRFLWSHTSENSRLSIFTIGILLNNNYHYYSRCKEMTPRVTALW